MRWFFCVLLIVASLMAIQASLNFNVWKYDGESQWINSIYAKKESAAASVSEPKIVVVGGSATLFGVSAKKTRDNLFIPAINLGSPAGLEIDYLLSRARKNIKNGDTVVLIPEYEHFEYHERASFIRDKFLLGYDNEYINSLSLPKRLRVLLSPTPADISSILHRAPSTYDAATINEYGDETKHDGVLSYTPAPIAINQNPEFSYIAEFADWCRRNNVVFTIMWPPMIDDKIYHTRKYLEFFKSLRVGINNLKIEILNWPEDSLMSADNFYDTRYHLNDKGTEIYTDYLISAFSKHFSPCAIMAPQSKQ